MTKANSQFDINTLIQIVKKGGKVKTGVDVYSKSGALLLDKDVLIETVRPLEIIKDSGIADITINPRSAGGLWNENGKKISVQTPAPEKKQSVPTHYSAAIENRVKTITKVKKEAARKYQKAKDNIKKVISDIRETGGEFDYDTVESTVTDLFTFITKNDNAFSYLTKEIFSYDDYLYHHSINTCTIATAILKKFNDQFAAGEHAISRNKLFLISIGYFLHDVGKVLIPDHILNKAGRLTEEEFAVVKTHSYEKGLIILEKNGIDAPEIQAIVKYHHGAIQADEPNCYPEISSPENLPFYVKICKLADIYDAMTSKRCYKDAFNPVGVVTEIVRKYATDDPTLRYLLHSFIKSVGIYPAGSIVQLISGQLGYVLDSQGPLVIPFTDSNKSQLPGIMAPIDMADADVKSSKWAIDMGKPLIAPTEGYPLLPDKLKQAISAP